MNSPAWMLEADCGNGCRPVPGTRICPGCDAPADWYDRIACKEQSNDLFFGGAASERIAIRICAGCEVRAYCLEKGWEEDHGVWGGYTASQRISIRTTLQLDKVTRRQRRTAIRELASKPINPR